MELNRRVFLGSASAFVVGTSLASGARTAVAASKGLANVRGGDADPTLFVSIATDGTLELTCHRSEMGQQTWTALAQLVADELEADWARVRVVQAQGDARYGDQNTDGSRSVRRNFHRL
ncbi:MAG: molybdopterin cofactor-binding domain-containing protein, partial [Myxococcota bacterium]